MERQRPQNKRRSENNERKIQKPDISSLSLLVNFML